ncbi:MAG: 60S ribosomal protein L31 [Nitrososphaerota archaeon]|jgi:large subunit ribosomal protein L31e|nr:60S ribosomal protein L31 [Nitrososphaerota archaeon]MDG6966184.1 60S ribosomal protein L31 [Nitrososphaerota archaeon]MDG6977619.1 60S ribosomal protein L31 [Nitrososphaerota archaeon]MDG7006438.1 60S ribosomal protein L31 [Nitrososphaerota archaeon]MDG7020360.1 60S ribosomal protein L31 [Nitrososphaerota archaeon]
MSTNAEPLTRVHMVPLRRAFEAPKYRRTKVAVRLIREFTTRHMKANEVKIDKEVNELLWTRGIGNPPRRIKLEMERDEDGVVEVRLPAEESS